MPLAMLQRMMGREGQVTGFVLQARSSDPSAIAGLRKMMKDEGFKPTTQPTAATQPAARPAGR